MILDESAFSDIDDSTHADEIRDAAYHGADIRPAWIGAHRPRTSVEALKGLANWASIHYDYYLNFVREYVDKRGDTLDIGCGPGQATAMLSRYSVAATGIDPDAYVIDFARKHNLPANAGYLLGSFPDQSNGSYDHIFCVETMEHIPYEKQHYFLAAALKMLRPGGKMFITTPKEDSPSPPHIGVWSPKWAEDMATHLGERVIKRGWFSNTQPVGFVEAGTHHAWVLA